MTATEMQTQIDSTTASSVFARVLVGVDGSTEAREAARQAAVIAECSLTLLAAYDVAPPIIGATGPALPAYYDGDIQRKAAKAALTLASADVEGQVEA